MKNNIVRISEIKPYQLNNKKHGDAHIRELIQSLNEFGWTQPICVDEDGVILAGHGRYFAAFERGDTEVPVVIREGLSDDQKKAYRLIDNKLSANPDWDYDNIKAEMEFLEDSDLEIVDSLLSEFIEEHKEEETPLVDDDVDNSVVAEKAIIINPGDVIEIAGHKVVCGDSSLHSEVFDLMAGQKAAMCFTDPPYLMKFEGNVSGNGEKSHNASHDSIANDNLSDEEGAEFISNFLYNIAQFTTGGYYISWYRLGLHKLFAGLVDRKIDHRALIIWDKGNHTLSGSDYQSKYEPIVYGWFDEHNFYGDRKNFDIWEVARTQKNDLHPTMKPLELMGKAIRNSSRKGEIVLDLFLGSGSTLIAAHELGRKCYGMELEPKYCEVIVNRLLKNDETIDSFTINSENVTRQEWANLALKDV